MNKFTKYYIVQVLVFLYVIFASIFLISAIVSGNLELSLYLITVSLYLIVLLLGTRLPTKSPSEEERQKLMSNGMYRTLYAINTKVPKVLSWAFFAILIYLFFFQKQ